MPQSIIVNGFVMTSGGLPRAGGSLFLLTTSISLLPPFYLGLELLLAEEVESQVCGTSEVQHLEVLLPKLEVQQYEFVEVLVKLGAALRVAEVFEDHFIVLELWKVVELYGLHLLDALLSVDLPLLEDLVPVHVIVAGAPHEVLRSPFDLLGSVTGIGVIVEVPVEDPVRYAERRGNDERPRVVGR
jgi:hypothetical protein